MSLRKSSRSRPTPEGAEASSVFKIGSKSFASKSKTARGSASQDSEGKNSTRKNKQSNDTETDLFQTKKFNAVVSNMLNNLEKKNNGVAKITDITDKEDGDHDTSTSESEEEPGLVDSGTESDAMDTGEKNEDKSTSKTPPEKTNGKENSLPESQEESIPESSDEGEVDEDGNIEDPALPGLAQDMEVDEVQSSQVSEEGGEESSSRSDTSQKKTGAGSGKSQKSRRKTRSEGKKKSDKTVEKTTRSKTPSKKPEPVKTGKKKITTKVVHRRGRSMKVPVPRNDEGSRGTNKKTSQKTRLKNKLAKPETQDPIRKKRVFRRSISVTRKIIKEQKNAHLSRCIPRAPFGRLVREIAGSYCRSNDLRMKKDALEALQEAAETRMIDFFRAASMVAQNRGVLGPLPRDIDLLRVLGVMQDCDDK